MKRTLSMVISCVIGGMVLFAISQPIRAAQEVKKIPAKSIKSPSVQLDPNKVKTIDLRKTLLDAKVYQQKLKEHRANVKSSVVKQRSTAITQLKSQNSQFDANKYDCDDSTDQVYPGAQEICDGIDNNCDGDVDRVGDRRLTRTYYLDADNDLWGDESKVYYACELPRGYSERPGDCNDRNSAINPSKDEVSNNNVDENCDGER